MNDLNFYYKPNKIYKQAIWSTVSEIISEALVCFKVEETMKSCLGAVDAWSSLVLSVLLPAENAAH